MMKKITVLLLFLALGVSYGQTTLSAGDIAITGVNSDNMDEFSFVLLSNVTSGTSINFTDNGWQTSGNFRPGNLEGIVTWVAGSDLSCGTEITIIDNGSNMYLASSGTATESELGFALAGNGDQILAYQGTQASPTFLYAIHFATTTGWTDATTPQTSAVPSGLTDGINAVYLGNSQNYNYNCAVTLGQAQILASTTDPSNWNGTNIRITSLGGCLFDCGPCSGGTITWNGTWSGTPDLTTEVVIEANYNTSTNGGSFSACSLTVNTGILTIANNDHIEVENDLVVATGGAISVQPSGAFIQNSDTGTTTNNGSIQVAKNTAVLNNWYEYTFWSSPLSDAEVGVALSDSDSDRRFIFNGSQFNDELAETGNNNMFVAGQDGIDDEGNDWQRVGASTVMQPGVGYAATHSSTAFIFAGIPYTYIFEGGTFNNGVYNVTVNRNDDTDQDFNWNLIGNPYPSAISVSEFISQNMYDATTNPTGVLDGALFFWSQNTDASATTNGNEQRNFSTTDYASRNGTGGTVGGDGLTPNGFIPSGQAFMVSFSEDFPASTGDVVFNNAMRRLSLAPDNSQFFKNSQSKKNTTETNKLWINLTSDNGVFNQILVGYIDGATDKDDGAFYDARKIVAPKAYAALYSKINASDRKFVIQGKDPNSLNDHEVIDLGFSTTINVPTIFKISIDNLEGDFLSNTTIYLKDNLENKIHDLSNSDYTFTSEIGEFKERFQIVFQANALSQSEFELDKTITIVQLEKDMMQFTSATSTFKSIDIFDVLGRPLYKLKGNTTKETYNLGNLKTAVYIANIELSDGKTASKKFIKN